MSDSKKPDFITNKIPVKGTPCDFQVASVKKKWAIRIIDNNENKVLKVIKLKKITSAAITDVIRDVIGRKYGKDYKIDEMDLGAKMATLLKQIDTYQKTGVAPELEMPIEEPKPTKPPAAFGKPTRQPDSFWSAYSTAVSKPVELPAEEQSIQPTTSSESKNTAPAISFLTSTTPPTTATTPPSTIPPPPKPSADLSETLSILGVNCPNCGAEVDIELDVCPNCGKPLD